MPGGKYLAFVGHRGTGCAKGGARDGGCGHRHGTEEAFICDFGRGNDGETKFGLRCIPGVSMTFRKCLLERYVTIRVNRVVGAAY